MACVNRNLPVYKDLKKFIGSFGRTDDAVAAYTKFRTSNPKAEYIIPTPLEYSKFLEVEATRKLGNVLKYLKETKEPTLGKLLELTPKMLHKWPVEFNKSGRLVITKGVEYDYDGLTQAAKARILQLNLAAVKKLEQAYPKYFTINKGLNEYYTLEVNFPTSKVETKTSIVQLAPNVFEYSGEIFGDYGDALKEFNKDYPQYEWLNEEQRIILLSSIDKGAIGSIC